MPKRLINKSTTMKTRETKLKMTLKANALFSLISGLTLLIFSETIAFLMNLNSNLPLTIIGVGLLLFVMLILFVTYQKSINLKLVKSIIIQDILWVIGSIILLIAHPFGISLEGNIAILIVAIIVLYFAIKQRKYSK